MQFQHLLQQAIARARRSQQYVAMVYLDVDRFKDINDTFGHAAGDTSLEIFARRVLAELGESSHAGRLAGDEFAVLITGFERLDLMQRYLQELAPRLLAATGKPFQVHGEEIFLTASMGIAVYPRDGDNVIDLIRNADAALYQAKKAGGNCFEYYSSDMNTEAVERLMLKSKLRRAFERDELRLHYQPKYRIATGRIEGVEALLRWDLPERGLVFPSDFVPLAEETNLILQLGDWVLNRVCADYRAWQRSVPSPCRVSLNLSLRQLQQRRFLDKVRDTFRAHGVSPTSLELEITETTLMEDPERTIRILDALYGMGLHLAIDDFGTGYSSLSALQQFPISTLKIDQSFVRDVAIDRDDAAIVDAIIQMAHSLRLEVVAEGVESEAQLEFLREHGCDYAQGHLFGDPVTAGEFCELLLAESAGTGKYRALFAGMR
jgi:diguanylate cyclase (GGDEF)-like protein